MTREKGLSLLELLITLSIAGLLALTSISTASELISRFRLQTFTQNLIHSLALARSEAVRRNMRVTVSSNNDHWEDGWIMFVDANNNTIQDADETILQYGKSTQQITIKTDSKIKSYVSYLPSGEPAHPDNSWQAGALTICTPPPTVAGYKLVLSRGGRVRQEEITDKAVCQT